MTALPRDVADDEPLHRRVHPDFLKPDGSVSSAAFKDESMSVDRARYWCIEHTMQDLVTLEYHFGFSLAKVETRDCRALAQDVKDDPILLNPAHALVEGRKTKATCKALARGAAVIVKPLPTYQCTAKNRLNEELAKQAAEEAPDTAADASPEL